MIGIEKLRLYLETTVFNYYFDVERSGHEDTVRLFEAIGAGEYEGYTSMYVTGELKRAQEPKRSNMLALVEKYGIKALDDDTRTIRLAELYIENKIIPAAHRLDSIHIAVASVHNLDCIVSYNFAHINRAKTKILTARINHEAGYNGVVICTSKEV
jgi:predicted nucleic acid-binding protein